MQFVSFRVVVVSEDKSNPTIERLRSIIYVLGGYESFSVVSSIPEKTDDIHVLIFLGLSRASLEREISNFVPMLEQVLIAIGDDFYDGEVNSKEESERYPIQGFSKIHINLGEKYFFTSGFGHETSKFINLFHHK